jgi:hypothetical protein
VQLNGFVVLYRKFREWEWYTDSKTKAVFIELILSASFRDSSYQGYEIKRGSLVTSIHSLAVTLGLTDKEVRTALNHLKRTGEVAIKTTSKFSIITVKNYDLYQDEGKQEGKQRASKGQAEGERRASKGQHLNNVTKKQGNKETIESPFGEYETFEEMAREMRK